MEEITFITFLDETRQKKRKCGMNMEKWRRKIGLGLQLRASVGATLRFISRVALFMFSSNGDRLDRREL